MTIPHPIRALKNSINGLKLAYADDQSFRYSLYQFIAGIVLATILVIVFHLPIWVWLLLSGSVFPILWLETVNTSIEAVTDKASPERHPLAKKAKDMGSAAVLLARIFALMCWGAVGGHYLL